MQKVKCLPLAKCGKLFVRSVVETDIVGTRHA